MALKEQVSKHTCTLDKTFGCSQSSTGQMWVSDGCRGSFTCDGKTVQCGKDGAKGSLPTKCSCTAGGGGGGSGPVAGAVAGEVWVRHLTNGDLAVAMPNLGVSGGGAAGAPITICLSALGWKHGSGVAAQVRDVWGKKDLGQTKGGRFTATVAMHDTLLLRLSPANSTATAGK